jgi:endonuclease YncB( thermonuclease family)
MPPRLKNSGATLAMYAADIPRRWRLAKPYLLPVAGAAAAIFVFGTALAPQTSDVPVAGAVSSPKTPMARSEQKTIAANADGVIIGRASAVSGDLLRVSGRLVRLAGIDAPQPAQSCTKSNGRRWACAASAVSALGRLVRGRKISCELKEKSGDGPDLAYCRAGDDDLAALLVRKGHVFASADFNGLYASDEETAKAEKLGVWQGETERPDAWRAKIWDEAKRSAPDGCPIKGFVRAGGRVYSMPWSEGYTGRNIKTVKGERWFCSEDEARAAGFRLSSRS